jgi:hypothetical protein
MVLIAAICAAASVAGYFINRPQLRWMGTDHRKIHSGTAPYMTTIAVVRGYRGRGKVLRMVLVPHQPFQHVHISNSRTPPSSLLPHCLTLTPDGSMYYGNREVEYPHDSVVIVLAMDGRARGIELSRDELDEIDRARGGKELRSLPCYIHKIEPVLAEMLPSATVAE